MISKKFYSQSSIGSNGKFCWNIAYLNSHQFLVSEIILEIKKQYQPDSQKILKLVRLIQVI